jgi:hypothetical protein
MIPPRSPASSGSSFEGKSDCSTMRDRAQSAQHGHRGNSTQRQARVGSHCYPLPRKIKQGGEVRYNQYKKALEEKSV